MSKKINDLSIFIFRRDLRLEDNLALIKALRESNLVIPIFIFTPEQIDKNRYKSNNSIQFMIESLIDLDLSLKKHNSKLYYFYGKVTKVLQDLINLLKISCIYCNVDYTKYSVERDQSIKLLCSKNNIKIVRVEDVLLNPIDSIKNGSNEIYTKFTPYFRKASKIKVNSILKNNYSNYYNKSISITYKKDIKQFYEENKNISVNGGRKNGLEKLNNIKNFKDYNKTRNILSIDTTLLSAYNKFGCVSIREVYHKIKDVLGIKSDLIKQLYWRDFYYTVGYYYSFILDKTKNQNFKQKYSKVKWITLETCTEAQKKLWDKFVSGITGYPIIDAAIRQLNSTGFMHNRGRLIVASFLTKNMFWDWRDGERYFATQLVDYDPLVNNGNWQWCSGSGVDSQPYYRIFNPWTQSITYDPDCSYIKKWVKELAQVDNNTIHNWGDMYDKDKTIKYYAPMLDYSKTREVAINKYKTALY